MVYTILVYFSLFLILKITFIINNLFITKLCQQTNKKPVYIWKFPESVNNNDLMTNMLLTNLSH